MNNELQSTVADPIQDNNPAFKPAVAMVDYCGIDISAFRITWPAEKPGRLSPSFVALSLELPVVSSI